MKFQKLTNNGNGTVSISVWYGDVCIYYTLYWMPSS